mgnify:CR=1 FL=1
MNPWIIITLVMAGIVFGIDYLLRKKKWKENSIGDKIMDNKEFFAALTDLVREKGISEEAFLERELDGYREYKQKVKYRLLPFVW